MNFKLKNIGKIAEADIKLDGITVICGNNNTGKSTVGKALFSFYNSLVNYKQKIDDNKFDELCDYLENIGGNLIFYFENEITSEIRSFINKKKENLNQLETTNFFNRLLDMKLSKSESEHIIDILNTSDQDIINEYISRFLNTTMNGQPKNVFDIKKESYIKAEFKNSTLVNTIKIYKSKCVYSQSVPIVHRAYYINNPFVLDKLDLYNNFSTFPSLDNPSLPSLDNLDTNVIAAITKQQRKLYNDKMSNIISSVRNKNDLDEVKKILKYAYEGDTILRDNRYFYHENGTDFNFANISTGLKSFALIERMLELGVLQKEDVLILDEPEIHLHSEWQIYYAELIVMLQKKFDLTILLVTHSFQFLESLDFFMKKHGIWDKGNYYMPESTDKGVLMKSYGNNPDELKRNLSTGTFKIADLEFELDMEQQNGEN